MLVAHRVAANLKGKDLAVADDVAKRDALRGFDGLDWPACGDSAKQRKAVGGTLVSTRGKDIDRTAAVVRALQQALVLKIGDVFVDRSERAEAETAGDFLIGRGVSVLLSKAGEKVENLFLPPRDCHAGIVANKKRIASYFLDAPFTAGFPLHF